MPNRGVQPIGDAAVVGVRVVGQSIALSFALGGFRVVLVEPSKENLRRVVEAIHNTLRALEELGLVDRWAASRARDHIRPSTSIAGARGEVGFAIDAAVENFEVKRGVLAELHLHCPARTVLATTTPSHDVSQLAASTSRPDQVVVTRWGSAPHLVARVEIVPGPATSERTIDWARGVLKYIGKEPVVVAVG